MRKYRRSDVTASVLVCALIAVCLLPQYSLGSDAHQDTKREARTSELNLDGQIGQLRTLPEMTVASAHWGGNSSSQHEFVYEPPPGWIIYSYNLINHSSFGDSWYTPQLTSIHSHYIDKADFDSAMSNLDKIAGQYKNYKAKAEIQEITKNSQHWYAMFQSNNNILRIPWGGTSREKKVGGIVVDTDTASLHLGVVITIARTLSPTELNLLVTVLKRRIARGESISKYFSKT